MKMVLNAGSKWLRQFSQRAPDAVLLQTLRTGPHVLLTMVALVVMAYWLLDGILQPWFLGAWSAIVLLFSVAHWGLVYIFRRLPAAQVEKHKKWWMLLSWHAPTVFSLLAVTITAAICTRASSEVLVAFTLPLAFFVVWSIDGWAGSSPAVLYLASGVSGIAWLFRAGPGGIPAALIMWSALPTYPSSRRRKVQLIIRHLELLEQTAKLDRELQERNRQLENGNQTKSYLLATASHGLRQHVHALIFLLEHQLLAGTSDSLKERMPILRSGIEQLSDMLSSLMDISRLDSGKYVPNKQPIDIHALLQDAALRFAPLAQRKGLTLKPEIAAARKLFIDSDIDLFGRMVFNLISNAIQFTTQGEVALVARLDASGALQISVQDSGCGIAPERQGDIFRAFARERFGGSDGVHLGIGLTTVEKGARLLGLGLSFQSAVGQGSCFTLEISADMLRANSPAIVADPSRSSVPHPSLRILIAEDDEVICTMMAELLRSWGHMVLTSDSLPSALQGMEHANFQPQVVLSDYQLVDGENGLDFIERIRQITRCADLPAILITGDVSLTLDEKSPSIRLLYKPLRPSRLRDCIESINKPDA